MRRLGPLLLLVSLLPVQAAAHPYAALRPVDSVLSGPTDGNLAALHYNPAALRLGRGLHLEALAGVHGYLGSYERQAPLPAGFSPGGPPAQVAPIGWAVPGYLIGGSWDLGTESVSIGAAVYMPYGDATRYADDDEAQIQRLPTRYHAVSASTYSLWGSAGAALRITSWLYLGGGFNFGWTRARRHFLRDPDPARPDGLPCGDPARCEQWSQRQDVHLDVGEWGFGFSAGALLIPKERLFIGVGYTSTLYLRGEALRGQPPGIDAPCTPGGVPGWRGARVAGGAAVCYGGAELALAFPHLFYTGGRVRLAAPAGPWRPDHVELVSFLRLAIPGRQDQELRLERRAFLPFHLPGSQLIPTAEQPSVAIEVGVRQLWRRLTLGEALLYESPRGRAAGVTPANIAGHRLDGSVTARIGLHRALSLLLTVGATLVLVEEGAGGRVRPEHAAACRAAGYDAFSSACREAQEGWAQPPAAGTYRLAVPHGAAGIEVKL